MIGLRVPDEALRELAEAHRVCVRPVVHQVLDSETGKVRIVATPCKATMASKCPPCAKKNRALRMQQCREGWHLDTEPEREERQPAEESVQPRRIRSTRRRQDAPDLPKLPVEQRTVGQAFTTPEGHTYRPSMFVTFTLPSYGRVRSDGTPMNPASYDYRRAALDALHFPKLVDRVWQNLRRMTGYQVQYFAVVEAQRRYAPHLHAAMRGAIPREALRQVATATYHQVWWPNHDHPAYGDGHAPVWRPELEAFVDPDTGEALSTWDEAIQRLDDDDDARPAHTLRLGTQLDIQGIIATENDADRRVAYLTKYLAKSFGDAFGDSEAHTARQRAHVRRLHDEVRYLPCSPRCWNWLRFGVQPNGAKEGMKAGACPAKAHDVEHLGCGGRRVLVSRKWTGKTLTGHKADRAEVVRQTLLAAGVEVPDLVGCGVDVLRADGRPRYEWTIWNRQMATTPIYRQVMTRTIAEQIRWKTAYERAKNELGRANAPPRPPDTQRMSVRGFVGQG